jgi:hypothetical protein
MKKEGEKNLMMTFDWKLQFKETWVSLPIKRPICHKILKLLFVQFVGFFFVARGNFVNSFQI